METRENNGDFNMDGEEQLLVSLAKINDGDERTEMDSCDNGDNVADVTMKNSRDLGGLASMLLKSVALEGCNGLVLVTRWTMKHLQWMWKTMMILQ